MIFPVPRKVFSTKFAAFFFFFFFEDLCNQICKFYMFLYFYNNIAFYGYQHPYIYIPELVSFPGKDSSKAVVDVEAEIKDAD